MPEGKPVNPGEMPAADDPELWAEEVKNRLEAARLARGISQNAFAEKMGVTSGAMSQRMNSSGLKEWWSLFKMAQELGVSIDQLFGLTPTVSLPPAIDPSMIESVVTALRDGLSRAEALQKRLPRQRPKKTRARRAPAAQKK